MVGNFRSRIANPTGKVDSNKKEVSCHLLCLSVYLSVCVSVYQNNMCSLFL